MNIGTTSRRALVARRDFLFRKPRLRLTGCRSSPQKATLGSAARLQAPSLTPHCRYQLFAEKPSRSTLAPPLRKRSRSRRLFACKRAHDGFALMLLHVPKQKKIEKADHFTVIGFLFKSGALTNCATSTIFILPCAMPAGTGTPEGTRTPDLLLRRQLLYPAELLAHVERVMGIEPTRPAWKAGVLPLNYTRRGFF